MFKNNEYVKKIKELWAIPRWHALMVIGIYILFFIIVGSIFALSKGTKKVTILEKYKRLENYSFNYKILENEIIGSVNDEITFKYNNVNYILKEDILSCDIEECNIEFKYLFDLFNPNQISEYIENGTLISSTNYTNGKIEKKYEIDNENVKQYFNSLNTFELLMIENEKEVEFNLNLSNYISENNQILIKYN